MYLGGNHPWVPLHDAYAVMNPPGSYMMIHAQKKGKEIRKVYKKRSLNTFYFLY